MDFSLENCIVADLHFSAPQVQKLLQYQHLLTYVLLDLQLLEKKINKLGEEKAIAYNFSREELDLLSKFASAMASMTSATASSITRLTTM